MQYSFSNLETEARTITVHSTYVHHEQFESYVVQIIFHRKGSTKYRRIQRSFSRIDLAEAHHAQQVIRLADKGYNITCSSCK